MALCAEMLVLGKLAASLDEARAKLQQVLDSGAAAERFARMVAALGGPADLLQRPDSYLAKAPLCVPAPALSNGYVNACDCRAVGLTVVGLGGGRRKPSDSINYAVGLSDLVELGARVEAGQPLAMVHAQDAASAEQAVRELQAAFRIDASASSIDPTLVYQHVPATGGTK
jgi:thymidine phosphorylase